MADFENYRSIGITEICEYVKNNAPEYLEVLEAENKDGKKFSEIKHNFYLKYFPNLIKPKKPTMKESIKALKEEIQAKENK